MKNINVFLYAYKNKKLKNIVDILINKSSKNNKIFFDIYDKDNEDKKQIYKDYDNVFYTHIFWDHNLAGPHYRNISLARPFDYFFEIGNLEDISNNWDEKLINIETNSLVTTGNSFLNIDFLFINKENSKFLNDLSVLKFYGQDIYLYYLLNKNNIDIKYFNDFYKINYNTILDSDYVPFSLYHHYNEVINMIKQDPGFKNPDNIDLNNFRKKHFQINDKNYGNLIHNLDSKKSEKFHKPIKVIQRVHE